MKIKITDEEAEAGGIFTHTPCDTIEGKPGWGTLVLPILKAKGVPDECLQIGDMRCVPVARHPTTDKNMFFGFDPKEPGVVFLVN